MKCEECITDEGLLVCTECDQLLCSACDSLLHRGGKRKLHSRLQSCSACRSPASIACRDCSRNLCTACADSHKFHKKSVLKIPKSLGVFWDISSFHATGAFIDESIREISARIAEPKFVKIYADGWQEFQCETKIDVVHRYGMKPLDALLVDASVLLNSGLSHVLIIAARVIDIFGRLMHLKVSTIQIVLATGVNPLKYYQGKEEGVVKKLRSLSEDFYCGKEESMGVRASEGLDAVVEWFKIQAEFGKILIEKSEVIEKVAFQLKISVEDSARAIDLCTVKELINQITIEILDSAFIMYSLKIPKLNSEVLCWVLRSLKHEELSPKLSVIKSQLLKTYNLLLSDWQIQRLLLSHSRNRSNFSTQAKISMKNNKLFPFGEYWQGIERLKTDIYNIKDKECWDEFLLFLEKYFNNHINKGIPNGRYGCALLIRLSGPDTLKSLSLGKIFYMINLALNDDLIRYHSKSIIWSRDLKLLTSHNYALMETSKKSLFSLISNSPSGITLAQIPRLFHSQFGLILQTKKFGYKGLKDFLKSLPELEIVENLVKIREKSKLDAEKLADIITEIIKGKEYGMTDSILQATLQLRLNQSIDWSAYNVSSCQEFVKQYSKASIEVLRTPECNILFRANEHRNYSYFFPFRSYFQSAILESSRLPTPQVYHPVSVSVDLNAFPISRFVSMQRMINVSNVPSEMLQKSPNIDLEIDSEKSPEPFIIEDLSVVAANKSIDYQHSKEFSLYELHLRTSSLQASNYGFHSHLNFSWVDKPFGFGLE